MLKSATTQILLACRIFPIQPPKIYSWPKSVIIDGNIYIYIYTFLNIKADLHSCLCAGTRHHKSGTRRSIRRGNGQESGSFSSLDESLAYIKRQVGCPIENDISYGLPGIGRQPFAGRNKISSCIVNDNVGQSKLFFARVQRIFNSFWIADIQLDWKDSITSGRRYILSGFL